MAGYSSCNLELGRICIFSKDVQDIQTSKSLKASFHNDLGFLGYYNTILSIGTT